MAPRRVSGRIGTPGGPHGGGSGLGGPDPPQEPPVLDPDDPRTWWPGPSFRPHPSGYGNAPATPLDRTFAVSATSLTNSIGTMFGATGRRIAGLCMAVKRTPTSSGDLVYLAFAFSWGELPTGGIASIRINDEDITGLSWILGYHVHLGSLSQTIDSYLSTAFSGDGFVETYPGLAYVTMIIDTNHAEVPSSMRCDAVVKGKKILDYRDSTTAETSNPILIMYHLLSDSEYFLGVDAAKIPTGVGSTWRDGADHADDAMGDATTRYSFDGYITDRDIWRAIETVGKHAFSAVHYVHDSYELKTLECPAAPRSIYIGEDDWIGDPAFKEIPTSTAPNVIGVHYTVADGWEPGFVAVEAAAGVSASELRYVDEQLVGCIHRSHATRWGTKCANHGLLERYQWSGVLPAAVVGDILPGHVVYLSTPEGVTEQAVRVEEMTGLEATGDFRCTFTEYDDGCDSTTTAVEDTPISLDTGVDSTAPDIPTAAVQTFGEVGVWAAASEITDPDALTAANGWATTGTAPQVTYQSTPDATDLEWPVVGDTWDWAHEFVPAGTPAYALVTLALKAQADHDSAATIRVYYDSYTGSWSEQWFREILPPDTLAYVRLVAVIPLTSGATNHRIRLYGTASGGSSMTLRVKRVHVVAWDANPRLRDAQLSLFERWSWTEHGSAADSVLAYQARRVYAQGILGPVVAEVPQGETLLEFATIPSIGSGSMILQGGAMVEDSDGPRTFQAAMITLGLNGQWAGFPTPTQEFQHSEPAAPTGVSLTWYRSRDRKTANSQAAGSWTTSGTAPVVTANVADSPDGSSMTADRVEPGEANGEIQCRDSLPAPSVWPGGDFYQFLWMKSESVDFDLELGSEFGGSGYQKIVRVRTHWRLFRQLSTVSGAPYPGPSLVMVAGTTPDTLVSTAVSWPTQEGPDLKEYSELAWTQDAQALQLWDRFELQFRLYDFDKSLAEDWQTHYTVGPLATHISWGAHPLAMAPPLPYDDAHGTAPSLKVLYDWRVVAIQGQYQVELLPTTVTEEEIESYSSIQELYEYDKTTSGDGELLRLEGTGDTAVLVSTATAKGRIWRADLEIGLTEATWATLLTETMGPLDADGLRVFYEVWSKVSYLGVSYMQHSYGVQLAGAICDTSNVPTASTAALGTPLAQTAAGTLTVAFQVYVAGALWGLQIRGTVGGLGVTSLDMRARYTVVQAHPTLVLGGMS